MQDKKCIKKKKKLPTYANGSSLNTYPKIKNKKICIFSLLLRNLEKQKI